MANGLTAKDLRSKTDSELSALLRTAQEGLLETRFQNHTNQLNDTAKISRLRKDIARIMLVSAERKAGKSPAASAKAEG